MKKLKNKSGRLWNGEKGLTTYWKIQKAILNGKKFRKSSNTALLFVSGASFFWMVEYQIFFINRENKLFPVIARIKKGKIVYLPIGRFAYWMVTWKKNNCYAAHFNQPVLPSAILIWFTEWLYKKKWTNNINKF